MLKAILRLTIICGCALAVSANAAQTESLSFKPQSVFQKRTEKPDPEPSRTEVVSKDRTGKAVSARTVEQGQKKALPESSRTEVASKDRTGKTVAAPSLEQGQKKALPEPSRTEVASKDRTGNAVSAPIVEQGQKKARPEPSRSDFVFKDRTGKTVSVPVIEQYRKDRIVHPLAKVDPRLDPKLSRAATIADERAHAHSKSRCWRYVKEALVASGAVSSYPKTSLAKEAGDELVRDYGFKKLPIRDPYSAPIGSVLVYFKGRNRPGHVEIRTKTGFVSDYRSKDACRSALVGVYAKK